MSGGVAMRGVSGIWSSVIRDKCDEIKCVIEPHANLRTNSGNDWQAQIMGGFANRGESGTATACSSTALTNTGAAFPTTANVNGMTGAYAGQLVAAGPNASGAGGTFYAVIVSNTATVLTVDRWVAAGSPYVAAGPPNGTCTYQVLPGKAPAWFLALSSTAITPAVADTTLSGELTTNGFSRTGASSWTHTASSSSYTLTNTFTATGTSTINAEALMSGSGTPGITASTGGIMAFENTEPSPPTLVSGDTLTQNCQVSY